MVVSLVAPIVVWIHLLVLSMLRAPNLCLYIFDTGSPLMCPNTFYKYIIA